MRIVVLGKQVAPVHNDAVKHVLRRLLDLDATLRVAAPFLEELSAQMTLPHGLNPVSSPDDVGDCDLAVVIGGDGSVLDAARWVRDTGIPVLGVNTGRLGFLSNVGTGEIDLAVDALAAGRVMYDERALLAVEVEGVDLGEFPYALNEVTVVKRDTSSMMTIGVRRDGRHVNTYWADGLIVATPTGSTAYSLSAGGPIVMPGSAVACLTPVAPHNLNDRPLVVPLDGEIVLVPDGREPQFLLTLDARIHVIGAGTEVHIRQAPFRFRLVNLEHQEFFSTVRMKLHWGVDPRDR
jgi:NAD+ kinase